MAKVFQTFVCWLQILLTRLKQEGEKEDEKNPLLQKKRASEHLLRQMGSEVSPTTDSLKSLDKIGGKTTFFQRLHLVSF